MTSLRVICGLGPPNQKSWLRLCLRGTPILVIPSFVKCYLSIVFTYLTNFISLALKGKKFEFWKALFRGLPIMASLIFIRIYEGHSKSNALKSNARTGFYQSCLYLAQT